MQRKNALNAFTVADPSNGKHLIETVTAPSNDNPGEYLDSFLVTFDDFGMHTNRVAHREVRCFLAKLFRFDFIK
jgi:hypothetical protein